MTRQHKSDEKVKGEELGVSARNHGIDLLKIIATFMVVVLHSSGRGGVESAAFGVNLISAEVLHIMTFCAVNVFGLTTGYLMADRKVKYARIVGIWLQIVFYGLLITAVAAFGFGKSVLLKHWLEAILPVTFRSWWYISAYFGLFFLMPYFNRMLAVLSRKQGVALGVVLLVLFSGLSTISPLDAFDIHNGFSMIWLCILYIWGALIKRYENEISIKPRWFALGYLLAVGVTAGSRSLINIVVAWTGVSVADKLFVQYDSITVVAMAMMLMLFFLRVKFPRWLGKAAGSIAPLSFGVYVIHEQPLIKEYFMNDRFSFLAEKNVLVMILGVLGFAALIFAVCALIEWGRVWLFKLLRINKLTDKIGGWMNAKILAEEEAVSVESHELQTSESQMFINK